MATTLKIVNKYLPTYVVRFYIHQSVFHAMKLLNTLYFDMETKKNVIELFKFIVKNDQSEIYLYICDNDNITSHSYRSMRFIPLMDDDVNICIIREADGYVGIADCHNINLFTNSEEHKIMMLYNPDNVFKYIYYEKNEFPIKNYYIDEIINQRGRSSIYNNIHYSIWLNLYELHFIKKSNVTKDLPIKIDPISKLPFVDILAGCVGVKIKLKKHFILDRINYLNQQLAIIPIFQKIFDNNYDGKLDDSMYLAIKKVIDNYTNIDELKDNIIYYMDTFFKIGYDEIILMLLYSIFTRVRFNTIDDDNILDIKDIEEKKKLLVLLSQSSSDDYYSNIKQDKKKLLEEEKEHRANIEELYKISPRPDIFDIFEFMYELFIRKYGLNDDTQYLASNLKLLNNKYINNNVYNYIYSDIKKGGNILYNKYNKYLKKNLFLKK